MHRARVIKKSEKQPLLNRYIGDNVLVDESHNYHSNAVKVYLLYGSIVSLNVEKDCLVEGWK